MAITGIQSFNNTCIVEVDSDPTVSIDKNCIKGSIAMFGTGSIGKVYKKFGTGNLDWSEIIDTVTTQKTINSPLDYDANLSNYRTKTIGGTGAFRVTMNVPGDFNSIVSMELIYSPTGGSVGAGKDIDLFSSYAMVGNGESFDFNTQQDIASVYDFTGQLGQWHTIDVSGLYSNLAANHQLGLLVDHKSIGGTVHYTGIKLVYL